MTEEEALFRVDEIGTAFDNDYNDGDGPDYESVRVQGLGEKNVLVYSATLGDGTEVEYTWILTLFERRVTHD